MKLTLRSFVFLDALSLVFLGMQLWVITQHFDQLSVKLSDRIQVLLMYPMFLLILVGAIGLFLTKKLGFILYYIQFPFRLYVWIFSVGFITWFPEALAIFDDNLSDMLIKLCFVAEFIRLYLTIRIHFKLFKR
jgi:type II secretory pathway component PulF